MGNGGLGGEAEGGAGSNGQGLSGLRLAIDVAADVDGVDIRYRTVAVITGPLPDVLPFRCGRASVDQGREDI